MVSNQRIEERNGQPWLIITPDDGVIRNIEIELTAETLSMIWPHCKRTPAEQDRGHEVLVKLRKWLEECIETNTKLVGLDGSTSMAKDTIAMIDTLTPPCQAFEHQTGESCPGQAFCTKCYLAARVPDKVNSEAYDLLTRCNEFLLLHGDFLKDGDMSGFRLGFEFATWLKDAPTPHEIQHHPSHLAAEWPTEEDAWRACKPKHISQGEGMWSAAAQGARGMYNYLHKRLNADEDRREHE